MIFMLLSPVWGLTREMKRIFEHFIQETRPRTLAQWFLNSKKSKRSLKMTRFVKISWYRTWRLWKKLRRFRIICHVRPLQTEASPKKNRSVEKDPVRFGVKVTVELRFDFKSFCLGNRQHRLIHVNFWYFSDLFDNFNLLTTIIEF